MALKKYSRDIACGQMLTFPSCCSAKLLTSLNVGRLWSDKATSAKVRNTVAGKIPANLTTLDETTYKHLMVLPAQLRSWPLRCYAGFTLGKMLKKKKTGQGGGDSWKSGTFIIADNVTGPKRWEGGSGFAEWCKKVPGVTVVESPTFGGAHKTPCSTYSLTITNLPAAEKYNKRSLEMINARLEKLRTNPIRIKRGLNDGPYAHGPNFINRNW